MTTERLSLMARHVVAGAADIPPGGRKLVEVNGRAVVVFNLNGEFFALNNRCPHKGGSLCEGVQTALVQSSQPGDYQEFYAALVSSGTEAQGRALAFTQAAYQERSTWPAPPRMECAGQRAPSITVVFGSRPRR